MRRRSAPGLVAYGLHPASPTDLSRVRHEMTCPAKAYQVEVEKNGLLTCPAKAYQFEVEKNGLRDPVKAGLAGVSVHSTDSNECL